jgi:adenylate cyclase class 2
MSYEVELKFRLENVLRVEEFLCRLGCVENSVMPHIDRYFNHPCRDFRTTDEAFRVRSVGEANCLTYKGAVIGRVAKTRREIEIPFIDGSDNADKLREMVELMGFRFVREVRKTRRSMTLDWSGRRYELALDEVPPLGCFLEIEVFADDDQRENAEKAVWNLAHELGLTVAEPRSYLHLLLESDG